MSEDEERAAAGRQQRRSDDEDQFREEQSSDGSGKKSSVSKTKSMAKTKSVFKSKSMSGIKSRMSMARRKASRGSAIDRIVIEAIAGNAAVPLDDLCDNFFRDLMLSVRPPDPDAAGPSAVFDAPPGLRGTTVVVERLRDVHDAIDEVERALDDLCESLFGVPGTGCSVNDVTVEQWFARLPRKDSLLKPSADCPETMTTYRLKKNGI